MRKKQGWVSLLTGALMLPCVAAADEIMIDKFESQPEKRWRFFTDSVMGGVSSGQVAFASDGDERIARMTGRVSTENNGGFIQFRTELASPPPEDANGVRLVARGNDQRYFVHLRTSGTVLPWQYYQAAFDVTVEWTEFRLPLSTFERSGRLLRKTPLADKINSVGIVAYGRDHDAMVEVREIGFY